MKRWERQTRLAREILRRRDKLKVYLPEPVFSHVQFCGAISRGFYVMTTHLVIFTHAAEQHGFSSYYLFINYLRS